MKPYHILPCTNLETIQKEVYRWIQSQDKNFLQKKSLWHKVNILDILPSTPSLTEYFLSLNLKPREVAFTVVTDSKNVSLHIDELPVTAKINIPISNTKNTFNQWYELPNELMSTANIKLNKFNKKYYFFENIDYSKLELIGEVESTQPIVFNSQIAHNIIFKEGCKFPRIVLSCTFFNEPLNYLKD